MAKESAKTSATEAKLESLGASEAPKKDPLSGAKKAFEEALQKTNDGLKAEGAEEKIIVEPVKLKAEKPEAKPTPKKVEPDSSKLEFESIKREISELRERLSTKTPEKKEEARPSDYDSIQAELSEQFGEEEGAILGKTLRALLEPRERRISHLENLIEKAVEQSKLQASKSNRSRLAKDYPHLEDGDDAWGIIQSQAQSLMSSGKYESTEEAFNAVAQMLYGEVKAKAEEDAEEVASRIAASTPTQPSAARRERKLTNEQKSRMIFDHLAKNPDDAAGAKRLAQQLRVDS